MTDLMMLIDGQVDFITGALANPAAQAAVQKIIETIKKHDGAIIATHDTHFSKSQVNCAWPPADNAIAYEDSLEGKKLPVPHCIKLSDGWEIEPSILTALQEKNANGEHKFFAVDKYTFGYHDWKNYLKGFKFDRIVIFGFCTDICVISNALILRALFPNLPIVVKKSCCAGVTPELHEAALKVMASCQIDIED